MRYFTGIGVGLLAGLLLAAAPGCKKKPAGAGSPDPDQPRTDAPAPDARTARPKPVPKPIAPPELMPPPATRRGTDVDTLHGTKVPDPYRWLEKEKDPAVKAWLAAHAKRARAYLHALPGRAQLRKRLGQLSYVAWDSPPIRHGKRYFFSRRHPDKEKVVHYWKPGLKGPEKVLFDPNTWSKDGSVALKGVSVDYQGRWAAYKKSVNNRDEATLYLRDVTTGKDSAKDVIPGAKYAHASWTPKGDGFYYTRLPMDKKIPVHKRPGYAEIYFHKVGDDYKTDKLVHKATGDPKAFLFPSLSRDGRFLFIYVYHGWTATDVYWRDLKKEPINAARPAKQPVKFRPFAVGLKANFGVYAWKGRLYLRTDLGAPKYQLFEVDPAKPKRGNWKLLVGEQQDAVLNDFTVVGNHLSLQYLRKATSELRIADLNGKIKRTVSFPTLGTASQLAGHPEDDDAYFSFRTYTRPTTIYRTSVSKGGRSVYYQIKMPIDPKPYLVEQVVYPSKDGTKVTMFIVRRKKFRKDGNAPLLLYGYGGFNVNLTPGFRPLFFVWLEQGGVVAIPNLRGGGEYGEEWHHAGMMTKKQNTFDDFIAAARYLIAQRYTSAKRLAIRGGSNGGLLVGAAMTQAPALFRAVACHVPLLDMVRYHLFGSGRTWINEYGSSEKPKQFQALHAYSPYHHIKPKTAYPALLMFTADSDDRVDPMHARKFVARLMHHNTSKHPVLLRVETKAGHGGGDMVKKRISSGADELAFLMQQLGMRPR